MSKAQAPDNAVYFIDLSSNNTLPRLKGRWLKQLWAQGYRTIVLKATEGLTYQWKTAKSLSRTWHRLGGNVWHYHYGRPANPEDQAVRFLATVKPYFKPGWDRLVVDVEADGITAAWVRAFINHCHETRPHWPGLVYSYSSFLTRRRIRPAHGWGLWIAAYQHDEPSTIPGWKWIDAWQQTNAAHITGLTGHTDRSVILNKAITWQAIPKLEPAPKPAPKPIKAVRAVATVSAPYRKSIVALLAGLAGWAGTSLADGVITVAEWGKLGIVVLTALGVYKVTNRQP